MKVLTKIETDNVAAGLAQATTTITPIYSPGPTGVKITGDFGTLTGGNSSLNFSTGTSFADGSGTVNGSASLNSAGTIGLDLGLSGNSGSLTGSLAFNSNGSATAAINIDGYDFQFNSSNDSLQNTYTLPDGTQVQGSYGSNGWSIGLSNGSSSSLLNCYADVSGLGGSSGPTFGLYCEGDFNSLFTSMADWLTGL